MTINDLLTVPIKDILEDSLYLYELEKDEEFNLDDLHLHKNLFGRGGIYTIYYRNEDNYDDVDELYVGVSNNLYQRLTAHKSKLPVGNFIPEYIENYTVHVEIFFEESENIQEVVEKLMIEVFKPPMNKRRKGK